MNKKVIYERHLGGGSVKRWIVNDKYLVSATYATGSTITTELLDCPGCQTSGWYYMHETEDECVNRHISCLEHYWTHACWNVNRTSSYSSCGIKYVDQLTKEMISEIENDPDFITWNYIHDKKMKNLITKKCYNPKTFNYE